MIISPGRRFIFVHIPKTAGTAMALALEARAMKDDMMLGDTPKSLKRRHRLKGAASAGRLWKHSSLADIEGVISAGDIAGFLTFTLVRNPWDRLVSYYHWLRVQNFDHPAVSLAKQLAFKPFTLHPITAQSLGRASFGSYMQLHGAEVPSLYIRIENFAADAQPLFDHLGFELDLPRVNISERERDYRLYYDREGQDAVARFCHEDIARFNYQF